MRLSFYLVLLLTIALFGVAYGQTMPQQQNCTTTTSGSISHTWCGPPIIVQVQAPPVTVTPAPVTVQPAPPVVVPPPPPAPKPEKRIKE